MAQGLQGIREAFTFDDVLLKPGLSDILPSEADIRSHVTRAIPLNIPIIASAMDTVTEARMAIAMAQAGGVGVIHRNFDSEGQAAQVRQVKKYESGMVVDQYRCVGVITVKDMEKAVAHPLACKDAQGRLRVAAATTVGEGGYERTERLIDAGVDLIVVDTAHGHSSRVLEAVNRIKRLSNAVQVIAGNIATKEGAQALIDAGADSIKVGIGPGSICTTRIVAGVGVPQLTAIMDAVEAAKKADIPVIADGGIK